MKSIFYPFILLIMASCSSTRMVDSWLNNDYANYQPKKVLIVGITDNLTARKIFEQRLKNEFTKRGIQIFNATSNSFLDVFDKVDYRSILS